MEGKLGQPRLRPPFPAVAGLVRQTDRDQQCRNPDQCSADHRTGSRLVSDHWAPKKAPGVKIFSLSGCVNKPGNYELPLGTTFRELIFNHGGGIPEGRTIKAIMSAGASSSHCPADDKALDTPMDYESTQKLLNAPLGSASVIILDDSVNMAWLVNKTVHFFKHESCGKCTPCREGTYWMS